METILEVAPETQGVKVAENDVLNTLENNKVMLESKKFDLAVQENTALKKLLKGFYVVSKVNWKDKYSEDLAKDESTAKQPYIAGIDHVSAYFSDKKYTESKMIAIELVLSKGDEMNYCVVNVKTAELQNLSITPTNISDKLKGQRVKLLTPQPILKGEELPFDFGGEPMICKRDTIYCDQMVVLDEATKLALLEAM